MLTKQPVDVQSQGSVGPKEKKHGACERRILSRLAFRNDFPTKAKGAENRKRGRREAQGGSQGRPSTEGSAVLVALKADRSAGLEGGREGRTPEEAAVVWT